MAKGSCIIFERLMTVYNPCAYRCNEWQCQVANFTGPFSRLFWIPLQVVIIMSNCTNHLYTTYFYLQGVLKNCTKFIHHKFATVRHRVVQFSAECSERNCLHDKGQCLNMATKYSLFCSWQVKYLKTKLTAKSLRQIRCINKIRVKPTFQN